MKQIKILIVDDHPMMREALRTSLSEEPGMDVIGEATDGIEAINQTAELHPDVILMDLLLPGIDGLEAIRRILDQNSNAKILVVSSLEDEDKIVSAIQAGALGYFPKTAPRVFLLEGIRKVADGVPYLPGGIASKLFSGLRKMKTAPLEQRAVDEPLTGRQEEILVLLSEGRSDKEIGEMLHLTETTVRSHIHNILQRLGIGTRVQAMAYANNKKKVE